jgi:hypothetical protein
MSPRLL